MRTVPSLAFAVAVVGSLAAQVANGVASKADAYVKTLGIEGTVLLARRGEVLLAKGYGLANHELGVPNKPETKFRVGSITKQFTATAILQLQEQGKLRVGDSIAKYLPSAPPAWNGITIHHLLSHTSGIPNYTDGESYRERMWERSGSPLAYIRRLWDLPLQFDPGTKFRYSNSGYFLLGVIIEQITGMRYQDYLRNKIFEPLQMSDTGYDWPGTILKDRASGYSKNEAGQLVNAEYLDMGQPFAAGSLYSTVLDLYKWDRALYTTKVLSAKSIAHAFRPNPHEWAEGIQYGYGWGISRLHGHKAVGHGGGINGFSTVIWRAIEEDAVVIILSNHDDAGNVGKSGKELLELILAVP